MRRGVIFVAVFLALLLGADALAQSMTDRDKLVEVRDDIETLADDLQAGRVNRSGVISRLRDLVAGIDEHLESDEEPPPEEDPCDQTFSGSVSHSDGFTVPADQLWCFDSKNDTHVTVGGNVVVEGTLEMRPAGYDIEHRLTFAGIDERNFVGGHTDEPLAFDVGLWVVHDGVLDAQGSPRAGWNRTGVSNTWQDDDEVRRAPIGQGSGSAQGQDIFDFPLHTPGTSLPTASYDGETYVTEVFNLTRNVVIESAATSNPSDPLTSDGRSHIIFLHVNNPQTIKYVSIERMGPRESCSTSELNCRSGNRPVTGRYPLHFHMSHDGTRGSLVEGVVVRDYGNRAFVPHTSHGITFLDTVAYNGWQEGYWWDAGDPTNDTVYDHAAVFKVMSAAGFQRGFSLDGFTLGFGTDDCGQPCNSVINSVAVGVQSLSANAGAFNWPSFANFKPGNVWEFENNVAHNNGGHGLAVWQNDSFAIHPVGPYVSFHNGQAGLNHGAYVNIYQFHDGVHFNNGRAGGSGSSVTIHACTGNADHNLRFDRLVTDSLSIVDHSIASGTPVLITDLKVDNKIVINERSRACVFHFHSSAPQFDLSRSDFDVVSLRSDIRVFNSDGSSFRVN